MKRLAVISHVVHYRHEGHLYAFGPYSREIDIWADLFPEVVIVAPCCDAKPPGDRLKFTRANITIAPVRQTGGDRWIEKVQQLILLPVVLIQLCRAMWSADAIHVRCPGNLGLLGVILARFFCRYRVAKFAGQWNGYPGESVAGRLQRWLLKSWWWGGPVTVYGDWPNQPPQVHSFFTSMMTDQQVAAATAVAADRTFCTPLRVIFSGRLVAEKRIHVFLEAIAQVIHDGVPLEVRIIGDGPQRNSLEQQARDLGIDEIVQFVGAQPFDRAMENYSWADCLILPSVHSEGWPKVIAEAMCHGLICIAVDHGQVGRMLNGRGILLPTGQTDEFAAAIRSVVEDPNRYQAMSRDASIWSRQYSLDGLRAALADLLEQQWQVSLSRPDRIPASSPESVSTLTH